MHPVVALVLGCAAVATSFQLFQLAAARLFFRRARRARWAREPLPAVTILKPLKGEGIDLYANLASFCRQDYPRYQIVFGVADPHDPAVAVVERIRRDFPHRDIALATGFQPGANRKVANLMSMMPHTRHDVLVLSDGDIRVRPDYLRTVVAPLADPGVGLTTCLYRGRGYFGLPSLLESLFINTDFVPYVFVTEIAKTFAYGASIAVRRAALDAIGGFPSLADYLADDNLLGERVAAAGWRLVLLPYVVETVLDSITLGDVWRHQLRWARTYRVCQPAGWFFSILTHATLWGLFSVVATRGSVVGWSMLGLALAARLVSLAGVMRLLGEPETPRYLWLVPAKDLISTAVWAAAWLGRNVSWSGQVLRVHPDGRMTLVSGASPAADVVTDTPRLRALGS